MASRAPRTQCITAARRVRVAFALACGLGVLGGIGAESAIAQIQLPSDLLRSTESSDSSDSTLASSMPPTPTVSPAASWVDPGEETDATEAAEMEQWAPLRYPPGGLVSPLNLLAQERLRSLAVSEPGRDARSFIVVGASDSTSAAYLYCLGREATWAEWAELFEEGELSGSAAYEAVARRFAEGSGNSFTRSRPAARVGVSAGWATTPNARGVRPIDEAIARYNPRFAIVRYGTNDMHMSSNFAGAIYKYYEDMSALLDALLDAGVVPIVSGPGPRFDRPAATPWVQTFDAVTRALAEERQIPFLDTYEALTRARNQGMGPDGVHMNAAPGGPMGSACEFSEEGLRYGYNVVNQATIQALAAVTPLFPVSAPDVLESSAPAALSPPLSLGTLDEEGNEDDDGLVASIALTAGGASSGGVAPSGDELVARPWVGSGQLADPFIIESLAFSHTSTTIDAPSDAIEAYPTCGAGEDASGGEVIYQLELDTPRALRVMAVDARGVDVDIYALRGAISADQLDASGGATTCVTRDDRLLEGTFGAGTWTFVVDTFVGRSGASPGAFAFVVVPCDVGDASCGRRFD